MQSTGGVRLRSARVVPVISRGARGAPLFAPAAVQQKIEAPDDPSPAVATVEVALPLTPANMICAGIWPPGVTMRPTSVGVRVSLWMAGTLSRRGEREEIDPNPSFESDVISAGSFVSPPASEGRITPEPKEYSCSVWDLLCGFFR